MRGAGGAVGRPAAERYELGARRARHTDRACMRWRRPARRILLQLRGEQGLHKGLGGGGTARRGARWRRRDARARAAREAAFRRDAISAAALVIFRSAAPDYR